MQDYQQLRVWQAAHALSVAVIDALPEGVSRRVPGLRAQAIRSASSIANNIAEGCGRASPNDFLNFLEISIGSANELEGQMKLAFDAKMIQLQQHKLVSNRVIVVRKMLLALRRSVQQAEAEKQNERIDAKR